MAYSDKQKEDIFESIFNIIESGKSLRFALKEVGISSSTFFIWVDGDEEKSKQYARACEIREEKIFDEILEIADKQCEDVIKTESGDVINHNVISRNRLQVDARKWYLSKLRPDKYGDKLDMTSKGEKITTTPIFGDNPLDKK